MIIKIKIKKVDLLSIYRNLITRKNNKLDKILKILK